MYFIKSTEKSIAPAARKNAMLSLIFSESRQSNALLCVRHCCPHRRRQRRTLTPIGYSVIIELTKIRREVFMTRPFMLTEPLKSEFLPKKMIPYAVCVLRAVFLRQAVRPEEGMYINILPTISFRFQIFFQKSSNLFGSACLYG